MRGNVNRVSYLSQHWMKQYFPNLKHGVLKMSPISKCDLLNLPWSNIQVSTTY